MAEFDFEKALKRLDEITSLITKGELSLDESIKLYQEGQEIVSAFQKALKEAEDKVEKIIENK